MRGDLSREKRLEISITKLKASNKQLRALILDLRKELMVKDKRIAELEDKLVDKEQQRKELLTYLYKPGKDKSVVPKQKGGRKPGQAFRRPVPPDSEVTDEMTFSLRQCPVCKHQVGEPVDTVVKYEEDIDLAPRKIVKKYTITRHWCSRCEEYRKSPEAPNIQRIGLNCLGYILYARYRLRLTDQKIQESLRDLYDFRISLGEIVEKLKTAEALFGQDYAAITELIKQASIVHADETGWRMDGDNWQLWVFLTDKGVRFVLEDTRGKRVAAEALGDKKDRVIVSDSYAIYRTLPGQNQTCWVHLIRVAKLASPQLHNDVVALYLKLGAELTKPLVSRDPPHFEQQLKNIIAKKYPEKEAVKVQGRIQHDLNVLLTCLHWEGVLPENNPAERAIRPQVIMRKIFGGSRSLAGAKAHEVNSSVIETLRKQNPEQGFFGVMLPLLQKRYSGL
jgi:hypothetical protein